jgi:hypothetical protein
LGDWPWISEGDNNDSLTCAQYLGDWPLISKGNNNDPLICAQYLGNWPPISERDNNDSLISVTSPSHAKVVQIDQGVYIQNPHTSVITWMPNFGCKTCEQLAGYYLYC